MTNATGTKRSGRSALHRWVRRGFVVWAVFSTIWLANSYRTRGVPAAQLRTSPAVAVVQDSATLALSPAAAAGKSALIFFCGSGVAAEAYVPMLYPIAETGHAVYIVKLPWRFAPLASHKEEAANRARAVVAAHPEVAHWIVSGHSLGGALACRVVQSDPEVFAGLVLVGTTHPKQVDLSALPMPVTKVYASNDGVAPPGRMFTNRRLLPQATRWIEIKGGNHSQFGHYGHQLFDGEATVSREAQQAATRAELLAALAQAAATSAEVQTDPSPAK
jgi:dienelactone hydrolase